MIEMKKKVFPWLLSVVLVVVGFFGGYFFNQSTSGPKSTKEATRQNKIYYISFDNYYYEVPKQKTTDDRLIPGGQFLYNVGAAIKTNTFDNLFNDGAIAVQALIPLNADIGAFERYINEAVKPSAASTFQGTSEVKFSNRKVDQIRIAEVNSIKDGAILRRQYIVNLPQSVAVVSKDDSEAFRRIGESIGQASAKFSDYEEMKLVVLSSSFMLSNRMFEEMYRLSHEDLRGATSVDELNRIADRSKEIFTLEAKVSGVKLDKNEMTTTIHYIDKDKPANTKTGSLSFRLEGGVWKLFTLSIPGGTITGATQ